MPRKTTSTGKATNSQKTIDVTTLVDRYAAIKESIELLEKQKEKLRKEILTTGKTKLHSDRYELTVQHVEQTRVDYKGLTEHLGATEDQIAEFSTTSESSRILVKALSQFDTRQVAAAVKSLLE